MFHLIFLLDNKYHFCKQQVQLCQNLDNNILHRNQSKKLLIDLRGQHDISQEDILLVIMSLFRSNSLQGRDNYQDLSLQSHYKVNLLDKFCSQEFIFELDLDQKCQVDKELDFRHQKGSKNLQGKQSFWQYLPDNNIQYHNLYNLYHSWHLQLRMCRYCTWLVLQFLPHSRNRLGRAYSYHLGQQLQLYRSTQHRIYYHLSIHHPNNTFQFCKECNVVPQSLNIYHLLHKCHLDTSLGQMSLLDSIFSLGKVKVRMFHSLDNSNQWGIHHRNSTFLCFDKCLESTAECLHCYTLNLFHIFIQLFHHKVGLFQSLLCNRSHYHIQKCIMLTQQAKCTLWLDKLCKSIIRVCLSNYQHHKEQDRKQLGGIDDPWDTLLFFLYYSRRDFQYQYQIILTLSQGDRIIQQDNWYLWLQILPNKIFQQGIESIQMPF